MKLIYADFTSNAEILDRTYDEGRMVSNNTKIVLILPNLSN